jgi:hypothetical protein
VHRAFNELSQNGSELISTLHADASEQFTTDHTIQSILQLSDFAHLVHGPLGVPKFREKIRNYISYVAQEETVLLPCTMQHPPQKGAKVQQKILYIQIS